METSDSKLQKIKDESSRISREVKDRTLGFITTAFGLVAGLAWNEAIQSLINGFFTIDKNSIWVKFIYAVLLTVVLVFVTVYLARLFGKSEEKK